MEGKSWVTVAVLDDLSDIEKNMQMYKLTDTKQLVDKDDRVTEFDSFKMERLEAALSKSFNYSIE